MALRGVNPEKIEKRFKAFFYGAAGVGKTTCALQFPKPYVIDTERGAENQSYVKLLKKSDGVLFQTTDFEDILTEVKSLLTEKHDYRTLVIDPLTLVFSDLCEKWRLHFASKSKDGSEGDEFQKHVKRAEADIRHFGKLLLRLDMNVIITAHAKDEWKTVEKKLVNIGSTYDCYKKFDHFFDLVIEVQKRGKERFGIVKKTRIDEFPDGETFKFSYDEIVSRYNKNILEKESLPEVLATAGQVSKIKHLTELLKISEEITNRWLLKANAENFEEMSSDKIQACIDLLESKIKGDK